MVGVHEPIDWDLLKGCALDAISGFVLLRLILSVIEQDILVFEPLSHLLRFFAGGLV